MTELQANTFTSIDTLIRERAETHTNDTILSYPDRKGRFYSYTGEELERVTRVVADHYANSLHDECKQLPSKIALIGTSSLVYYITFLALQRLGLSTFFISPRLADQGFAHLLQGTDCRVVVASEALRHTLQRVDHDFDLHLEIHALVRLDSLRSASSDDINRMPCLGDGQDQKFIIHSGGTSGLPKPVTVSAETWLKQAGAIAARMPQVDTLSTLPLFHSFGLATLLRCLVNGRNLSLMSADRPITASAISAALDATGSKALVTVPYILKFFAELEGGIERLVRLDQVVLAGSAIPGPLAEICIERRVNIFHLYGLTECGALMEPIPTDFRWVTPLPHTAPFLRFDLVQDGLYHLTVLPGLPAKVISTAEDGSYATKDLFHRHPSLPNVWKFAARHDDIIVMLNGEKADPTPLEEAVSRSENVEVAIVFGAERESLGMIVVASEKAKSLSAGKIVQSIAHELEVGNSRVPAYARITIDAVIVKEYGTMYPRTDKHTVKRSQFLNQFSADVERYYEESEGTMVLSERCVSEAEMRDAVRNIVQRILGPKDHDRVFDDFADFFSLGMDSLQASRVRSLMLKTIPLGSRSLATNVVFEHPSVDLLTAHVSSMLSGGARDEESAKDIGEALIAKYSRFDQVTAGTMTSERRAVLLTGATGAIGVHILHHLLLDDRVAQVHCLVRASSPAAAVERIHHALQYSKLLATLSEEHLSRIHAHPCEFTAPNLGLNPPLLEKLRSSVTHFIHNAWSVNFNQSLRSFEQQCIQPIHFLLSIAASSPLATKPIFTFVSSIAVTLQHKDRSQLVPEELVPWASVADMGYAQSKFVGEEIAAIAARDAGVPVRIARVGQVCGDTVYGMWNPTEAVPLTVQAAITIGALPEVTGGDEELHWLPADVVGRALVELTLMDAVSTRIPVVVHIWNDMAIGWNAQFLPWLRQAGLEFEVMPQEKWLQKLESSDQDVERNPPVKLKDFFRSKYGNSGEKDPNLDTTRAHKLLPCLQNSTQVDARLVQKFLSYWAGYWRK